MDNKANLRTPSPSGPPSPNSPTNNSRPQYPDLFHIKPLSGGIMTYGHYNPKEIETVMNSFNPRQDMGHIITDDIKTHRFTLSLLIRNINVLQTNMNLGNGKSFSIPWCSIWKSAVAVKSAPDTVAKFWIQICSYQPQSMEAEPYHYLRAHRIVNGNPYSFQELHSQVPVPYRISKAIWPAQ